MNKYIKCDNSLNAQSYNIGLFFINKSYTLNLLKQFILSTIKRLKRQTCYGPCGHNIINSFFPKSQHFMLYKFQIHISMLTWYIISQVLY